jgi:hypothetical protein
VSVHNSEAGALDVVEVHRDSAREFSAANCYLGAYGPLLSVKLLILGNTLKLSLLLAVPPTVLTGSLPVVAPKFTPEAVTPLNCAVLESVKLNEVTVIQVLPRGCRV